jgi:hypothetical protein
LDPTRRRRASGFDSRGAHPAADDLPWNKRAHGSCDIVQKGQKTGFSWLSQD